LQRREELKARLGKEREKKMSKKENQFVKKKNLFFCAF